MLYPFSIGNASKNYYYQSIKIPTLKNMVINMITTEKSVEKWRLLYANPLGMLPDARLQLHHSAQILAAIGKYLLPERADDSHTSLIWLPAQQSLAGEPLGKQGRIRGALRPMDFSLLLLSGDRGVANQLKLDGKTLSDALAWVKDQLRAQGIDSDPLSLKVHYEIPHHPVKDGQAFCMQPAEAFAELGKYFGNAHLLLSELQNSYANVSAIRCWPHHFDIAMLITVVENEDPEKAKSIGVGLSPGDGGYSMPYFYVTPWPYPDPNKIALPTLDGNGRWHTEGWVGAILPADRIVTAASSGQQVEQVRNFLNSAINASQTLIG